MRLHCRTQGEGQPLIILHGFLGSLDNWQVMSRRLARDFKIYSLDLRNHGRSPHSAVMNYPAMAQDVREFIAEHGLTAASVLGHSMGGKVAMQFAAHFPDDLEKLVVVDIAPKAYASAHRTMLHAMRAANLRDCSSFGEVGHVLSGAIPDPAVRQFVMKNLTRDTHSNFQWRLGLDEITKNYDELTHRIVVDKPFAKPACFIRGERSNFVQDSDLALIRDVFPRAEFKTIPNAGHWIHIDAAGEFQAVVTNFLTRRDG
jgi:esterase